MERYTSRIKDVSGDATWHPVVAVEETRDTHGTLVHAVNHSQMPAKARDADADGAYAVQIAPVPFRIEYYQPDGHVGGATPDRYAWLVSETYPTESAASTAIHRLVGYNGGYRDQDGHMCEHESDEDCCGGFTIRPAC